MDNKEDDIISINDFRNAEGETMDADEVVDISDREFVETIYASDNFDSPCCWLVFSVGAFLALKESIEWGYEEKDGVTKMVPNYFETILGDAYTYVR